MFPNSKFCRGGSCKVSTGFLKEWVLLILAPSQDKNSCKKILARFFVRNITTWSCKTWFSQDHAVIFLARISKASTSNTSANPSEWLIQARTWHHYGSGSYRALWSLRETYSPYYCMYPSVRTQSQISCKTMLAKQDPGITRKVRYLSRTVLQWDPPLKFWLTYG